MFYINIFVQKLESILEWCIVNRSFIIFRKLYIYLFQSDDVLPRSLYSKVAEVLSISRLSEKRKVRQIF